MGVLQLEDDAFWGEPLADETKLTNGLFERGVSGLALDGPGRVDLDARATLPIVAVRIATYAELWRASLRRHGILVATRLESNVTVADSAERADDLPPERPRPTREPPRGKGCLLAQYEARARLGLEWRPGTYLLRLVIEHELSPPLRVVLARRPGFDDPGLGAFLEARQRPAFPEHVSPPAEADVELPRYRPLEGDPAPPPAAGLLLDAPKVVLAGQPIPLRGALRLVPRRADVVRPRPEDPLEAARWQDPGDPEATAIVAVTLVIVQRASAAPLVVVLRVPTYTPLPDPARPVEVEATFAVDLARVAGLRDANVRFVHAFAGEHAAVSVKVASVTADMLRDE